MKKLAFLLILSAFCSSAFGQVPLVQVDTASDMMALTIPAKNNKISAIVKGLNAAFDGSGGIFAYQFGSSAAQDGTNVFKPNLFNGRWIRIAAIPGNILGGTSFTNAVTVGTGTSNSLTVLNNAGAAVFTAGGPNASAVGATFDNGILYFPAISGLVGDYTNQTIAIGIAPSNAASTITMVGDADFDRELEIHNYYGDGIQLYTHSDGFPGFRSPSLRFYKSLGTQAAPTAVHAGNRLFQSVFGGYDGTGYNGAVYLYVYATEDWSSGHNGGEFDIAIVNKNDGQNGWYAWKMKDFVCLTEGGLDIASNIVLHGTTATYNNISTAGVGQPAIYGAGRTNAATGAVASIATYTPTADSTLLVSANVLITTATTHSFTVTCSYTSEDGTSRVQTLNFSTVAGVISNAAISNTGGTVPYAGVPVVIRAKGTHAVTIGTTGTFTTVVYNADANITRIN